MPLDDLGISFSPFGDPSKTRTATGAPAGVSPQEAIRVLSLRIPRVAGAASPIPQGLLTSPGSAGIGGGMMPSSAPNPLSGGPPLAGGTSPASGGMGGNPSMTDLEELLRRLFGNPGGGPPPIVPPMSGPSGPSGDRAGLPPPSAPPPPHVNPGAPPPMPTPLAPWENPPSAPTPSAAPMGPSPTDWSGRDRRS